MLTEINIPHDSETEKRVLAELMLMSVDQVSLLRDSLYADLFYEDFHKELYNGIERLNDKGKDADTIAVINDMRENSVEVNVLAVAEIANHAGVSTVNAKDYISILDRLAKSRRIWEIGQTLIAHGSTATGNIDSLIEDAQTSLARINSSGSPTSTMNDTLNTILEIIDENVKGKPRFKSTHTGFKWVDDRGGFLSNNLIVVAGATSMGKTSFVNTISYNAIRDGSRIAYYSLEMSKEQLVSRLISMETNVKGKTILTKPLLPAARARVEEAICRMKGCGDNMFFDDRDYQSIDDVIASIRYMVNKHNINGVMIDYIQLLEGIKSNESKEQFMASCARRLKNIAKKLNIWVCVLSQLNRDSDPEPQLERIRDSAQIADAADIVMFVYRPEYFNEKKGMSLTYRGQFANISTIGTAMIKVDKFRDDEPGAFITRFDASTTSFHDYEEQEIPKKETVKESEDFPF